nr:TIGR04282 family arsenosugar biosynthesis glycosyltransferase [uncultured Allomuricauda sp.]
MSTEETNLLLIFTRNPELGKCKTRLAAKTGDRAALDIYKFLLNHTVSFTHRLSVSKSVYYSEEIWENDIWDNSIYQKRLQTGKDLGKRMEQAFAHGFDSGFKKIIIIGSDMYNLSKADLEDAFSSLDKHDFVIGPAQDGGYYLLGMTLPNSKVFQNKNWGTETVLEDTLKDLEKENFFLLPEKNDVDHYEDIKDVQAFQPFLKHMKND